MAAKPRQLFSLLFGQSEQRPGELTKGSGQASPSC